MIGSIVIIRNTYNAHSTGFSLRQGVTVLNGTLGIIVDNEPQIVEVFIPKIGECHKFNLNKELEILKW